MPTRDQYLENDPLWYKDAIIYQLHVKTFHDSDGDGMGDFIGLTEKLDYLERLGVTAVWLLPFYPSPLKDDGYDIADYRSIHPHYGALRDFKRFLREAHARGIRVITELVLNHTSDQHPWFQRSRHAKAGTIRRNYYVWSDTPDKYCETRIIFQDFETSNWAWDAVAKAYYWHRFYSHQPDLNYDHPHVHKEMQKIIDYWMEMGVDGMRLDAVPYLYEREGTNCENLPETYGFLRKLRKHVDKQFDNKVLLAEANQWPEDAVAYLGDGDICHMAYHFPIMPRMYMSLWMEDRFPIMDIIDLTPPISERSQWALFLRNHDELTLEMVTDEERDYMYKVYARDSHSRVNLGIRRRLAPLLANHRRKIELMNILLFSLPGTPIIYYGDEIGMGDNYYLGDRSGVRTPMQWSADRNAGFSRANPQKLYLPVIIDPEYHFEAINVENQDRNTSSLLWWMRRVIAMRKRFKSFGRGTIEFLYPDNPKVLAFIRSYEDEHILVVVNLSRFSQVVELDIPRFAGYTPEEVFSTNKFPLIKDSPYILTLGVHDYYWFLLRKEVDTIRITKRDKIPELKFSGSWEKVLLGKMKQKVEEDILPRYLCEQRWFGGKARKIRRVRIREEFPLGAASGSPRLLFIQVIYTEGESETYLLCLTFTPLDKAQTIVQEHSNAVVMYAFCGTGEGIIHDAFYDEKFRGDLLNFMKRRRRMKGRKGSIVISSGRALRARKHEELPARSEVMKAEQSNTSLQYGNEYFLKIFRKLEEGINPEIEITRHLTEKAHFPSIPHFAGSLEYKGSSSGLMSLGILQRFMPNEGDAWTYTIDAIRRYYERVLSRKNHDTIQPALPASLLDVDSDSIPKSLLEIVDGVYPEMIRILGQRTAQLHNALSCDYGNPAFKPEAFSTLYQRSLFQSMQSHAKRIFSLMRKNIKALSDDIQDDVRKVLNLERDIISNFRALLKKKMGGMKIRIHGDFHLGQVLFTGNDFLIIDFEDEPVRSLSERRLKRSPIRDVSGMIRSFHYAAYATLFQEQFSSEYEALEAWADLWFKNIAGLYLRAYLDEARESPMISHDRDELSILLKAYLLEKALYEIGYEMNNRPSWLIIPIKGIMYLLED